MNDGNNESIWDAILEGAVNGLAVDSLTSDYYYLITDGTKQNRVTKLYLIETNMGMSYTEFADNIIYKGKPQPILDKNGNECGVNYWGLISEPDYEELYNYFTGKTKSIPKCVGCLDILDNSSEDNSSVLFVIYPY